MKPGKQVDLVITWVDGSDARWREKRRQYQPDHTAIATANVEGRFRDNGELRYLLRSIERYWPSAGKVYLVTDQQRPAFLRHDAPITIVDHSEILDSRHLPTFSSMAIESALHKIPGLADRFVVFNDDLVLMRPITDADFFDTKGCLTYVTAEQIPVDMDAETLAGEQSALMAQRWVSQHFDSAVALTQVPAHAPSGIVKARMIELESNYPDVFESTRAARYRTLNTHSITTCLYHFYMAAIGCSTVMPDATLYLYSDQIESGAAAPVLADAHNHYLNLCVQDVGDDRHDMSLYQEKLQACLQRLFPTPSRWERIEDTAGTTSQ